MTPARRWMATGCPPSPKLRRARSCRARSRPHSRFHYDDEGQSAGVPARASCEHYGLGDGEGGVDQTTLVSYDTYRAYSQDRAYNDCGGGWSIYMRQSLPGDQNPARDVAGQAMKNWWPFLYY